MISRAAARVTLKKKVVANKTAPHAVMEMIWNDEQILAVTCWKIGPSENECFALSTRSKNPSSRDEAVPDFLGLVIQK